MSEPPVDLSIRSVRRLQLGLRFAAETIASQRRRVLFAAIGVAVGIAAVTSMLTIGHSVTAQARQSLERLGADVITLGLLGSIDDAQPAPSVASPNAILSSPPVDPARLATLLPQAAALLRNMPQVADLTPIDRVTLCPAPASGPLVNTDILATAPDLPGVLSLSVASGRFLHPLDGGERWVVLGADVQLDLQAARVSTTPGSSLELCGRQFRIAGTLQRYFGDELLPMFKINRALLISHGAAARLTAAPSVGQLLVRVHESPDGSDPAELLAQRLRDSLKLQVSAAGAREFARHKQEQVSLFTRFLTLLGGVALIVASIGITNVMQVSVSERRGEIALRAALGARPSDIALQFLVESVLICLCGAMLGLALGMTGTLVALWAAGIGFAFDPAAPLVASLLALLCGLVAGAYPALRAARMDPATGLQAGT